MGTASGILELGLRDIPTDVLCRLAYYYNTSTDDLLGRPPRPEAYPKEYGL